MQYLRHIELLRDRIDDPGVYPFTIPAIRGLDTLAFPTSVTFFVGENGSGKSTLIEAIAVLMGFNPEGGSRNFGFSTRDSTSELCDFLRPARGTRRPKDGFFLRAESYFNLATEIERLDEGGGGPPIIDGFGGVSLHEQSHGESFMALASNRLRGSGLYIFDEPEAALSPQRQLELLAIMHRLAESQDSQFIIATHSPILMGYPGATIFCFGRSGVEQVEYEETEHVIVTKGFLNKRKSMLKELLRESEEEL
ncbi:MAG: AAA family ATPase [Myxococcota bacterium]